MTEKKTEKKTEKRQRLKKAQKIILAEWIAEGLTSDEINLRAAKFNPPFEVTRQQVDYYRKKYSVEIKEILAKQEYDALNEGLAKTSERIKLLKKLAGEISKDLFDDKKMWLDRVKMIGHGKGQVEVEYEEFNSSEVVQLRGVLEDIAKELGARQPAKDEPDQIEVSAAFDYHLPASAIGPAYFEVNRLIDQGTYTKYVEKGGRGSLKSSFFGLKLIERIKNNPDQHALVLRQVQNTLRDSVYSQIEWAINYLGLDDEFKCTTSPLQIEYVPTGQIIYFRGGDKPLKIKSIKPKFGYIGTLWFEELDQFHGENSIRSIFQSAVRGGDDVVVFYSFNPPPSKNNWVYKWLETPDKSRYVHHSTYLEAPVDWLGESFIREAEHIKEVNPKAYQHEYLGEAISLGGLVFDNVEVREITDEEIAQFDRVLHGLDWGYSIDPASYGKMHYDAARMTLYIFGEYRGWKESNRELYDHICEVGYNPSQLLIPDSAEPKSIADLKSYGAYVRGAEKGPDSVRYSMKWLQTLNKIVVDPVRAPYHKEELTNYEYEQNRDGEYISAYPDKDNHAIDDVRYGTNLIWRRAGH